MSCTFLRLYWMTTITKTLFKIACEICRFISTSFQNYNWMSSHQLEQWSDNLLSDRNFYFNKPVFGAAYFKKEEGLESATFHLCID